MALGGADCAAASAAGSAVVAGNAAAIGGGYPPYSIDIIDELATFQSLPTSLPTREKEKEINKEEKRKNLLFSNIYFVFPNWVRCIPPGRRREGRSVESSPFASSIGTWILRLGPALPGDNLEMGCLL